LGAVAAVGAVTFALFFSALVESFQLGNDDGARYIVWRAQPRLQGFGLSLLVTSAVFILLLFRRWSTSQRRVVVVAAAVVVGALGVQGAVEAHARTHMLPALRAAVDAVSIPNMSAQGATMTSLQTVTLYPGPILPDARRVWGPAVPTEDAACAAIGQLAVGDGGSRAGGCWLTRSQGRVRISVYPVDVSVGQKGTAWAVRVDATPNSR
jgi:hypothetical protein